MWPVGLICTRLEKCFEGFISLSDCHAYRFVILICVGIIFSLDSDNFGASKNAFKKFFESRKAEEHSHSSIFKTSLSSQPEPDQSDVNEKVIITDSSLNKLSCRYKRRVKCRL